MLGPRHGAPRCDPWARLFQRIFESQLNLFIDVNLRLLGSKAQLQVRTNLSVAIQGSFKNEHASIRKG